jgi:S-adenosylmethionine synthetase
MKLYTNEIVFRGHPDKVCDQISGALLDAFLRGDKDTRAGIEVVGGKGKMFITGEVTSKATVDVEKIARGVLLRCGYSTVMEIINNLGVQSGDIAMGVDTGGAGDNGMMFGYACNDTKEMLPTAMVILQKFAREYDKLWLRDRRFKSDGKAQITGEYDTEFNLKRIVTFTICYQNTEKEREATDEILKGIATRLAGEYGITIEKFLINPTGRFEIGGFDSDAGMTGRKIVVDAYQSFANVGGGAMNGKDPSKVDISGAHKARELAKEILKKHKLKWCEVQLSFAIGQARPLAIYIDSSAGNIEPTEEMYKASEPRNIIKDLKLKEANYEELAKFGHFTN